ncbi:hypothetical protein GCM10027596_16520 [Nocardioides korecus]
MSDDGGWGLRPLEGGASGETFLSPGPDGVEVVLRIYGGRSLARGPRAPEVDAAVLELVAELVPVPRVLEVRPGDPSADLPGLLVCERVEGVRLADLVDDLDDAGSERVGRQLGAVAARLGHVVHPAPGLFLEPGLVPAPLPSELRDLEAWVEHHAERLEEVLGEGVTQALRVRAAYAEDLLATTRRRCLVHGDLGPANVLVDPGTLEVSALLDWEFAHVGSAWTDLGHLLRGREDDEAWTRAVLTAYADLAPRPGRGRGGPDGHAELLALARAADLWSLVELAARTEPGPGVDQARELLARTAGDQPGSHR